MDTFTNRHRSIIPAAGATSILALSVMLTGCANPIESAVESLTSEVTDSILSEATGTDIDISGENKVPEDFPTAVPLPDGTIQMGGRTQQEGQTVWMLHYSGDVNESTYEKLLSEVAAAGFQEENSTDISGAMRITTFKNSDYMVSLSLLGDASDEQVLQIQVVTLAVE